MRRLLMTISVLCVPAVALAQNPCAATAPTVPAANPSRLYVTLPEHTAVLANSDPAVSVYQIAYFAQGANPNTATPVQGPSTVQKSSFTLVTGTTNCYLASGMPLPIPTGATVVGALKSVRSETANTPGASSPWSELSNPFFLAAAPLAPSRPLVTP